LHQTRSRWLVAGPLALTAAVTAAVLVPGFASGSSHREAPGISQDPTADNTDVYAFTSPDDPSTKQDESRTATLIANYIPLEEPSGGPNYYQFSDKVRYTINVDNTGDGREDVQYAFRFHTSFATPSTFLYATGPVTYDAASRSYKNLNIVQTYDVQKITRRGGRTVVQTLARNLLTPPDNAGGKSTPNYASALVPPAIHTLKDGTRVFAGQRDDPFFVDLGATFDLVNLERRAQTGPDDGLTGYNVHTIALQVPKSQLTRKGNTPAAKDADDPSSVIGVYAAAERPVVDFAKGGKATVGWKQVSRLGEPLVNEVVIPIGKKDAWNATDPADDAQFLPFYQSPGLAAGLNALFGAGAPTTNRNDLVAVLLTGLPPGNPFGLVTQIGPGTPALADLLRLNLAIPPTPPDKQDRLGVLAGQADGFPNGRRLVDDVVDIELRAVAGVLTSNPPAASKALGDGVDTNDQPFLSTFPYVATPIAGVETAHPRPPTFPPAP
jgi:uncharacterized protein DUF4331